MVTETYKCKVCGKEFNNSAGTIPGARANITKLFTKHLENEHKMSLEEYIVKYFFNGQKPVCKCGCGKEVSFIKKNCLWDPSSAFHSFFHCSHVARNNEEMKQHLREHYRSKYEDIENAREYYYENFGKELIEESAKDFLTNDTLTNIDIGKKYNCDIRTLRKIWRVLKLVSEEQWEERCKFRKFQLSSSRRRKKIANQDYVLKRLYDIIKSRPMKYNIRSLIKYYNDECFGDIEADPMIVLKEMRKEYGDGIFDYLHFGAHSKEELDFLNVLKFFCGGKYSCGKAIQYGRTKRDSYIYDICVNDKLLIEYDGNGMFHKDKNRDDEKEIAAKRNGYKFLRVSLEDSKKPKLYEKIKKILSQ